MVTERMRAIIESIAQLPAEAQDQLAAQIANALDEARWQALLRDPERLERLRALADEAMEDEVRPFPTPADEEGAQ